ncbi:hypothetical protein [Streptomyces chattanoogensis]|uniref:Uncharacterized protein n=1 Tax=Streptomyces chattanoogensis TaxID=66876 RepID=A0A0N1JWQ9_9ACTN|nr:hypothetical protein [Streptomyces chattanoogensis]KPC60553.1 hypothetical protein ADL29_29100 [Streptomyces chattanoogensis]
MVPKSFYDVRFGVSPGGARKDAHHICGSLDEAMAALDSELEESLNVWLLFEYGADLALDVYQRGERVRSIDLHPFVTIRVDGYPDITFRGPGKPTGYAVGADDPYKVKSVLEDGIFSGDFDDAIEVTVDWGGVVVPPLVGEIAKEGDYVMLGDGPLDDLDDLDDLDEDELEDELIERGYVEYGSHDFDA